MNSKYFSKLAVFLVALVSFLVVATAGAAAIPVHVGISGTAYTVSEAQGSVWVPISLTSGSNYSTHGLATGTTGATVSVHVYTYDGTAKEGTNYTGVTQALTWAEGDSGTQWVQIPILDAGVAYGGSLTFSIQIYPSTDNPAVFDVTSKSGYDSAVVSIKSAHSATTTDLKFRNSTYIVREPATLSTVDIPVDVVRATDPTAPISVYYTTVDGLNGVANRDYYPQSGILTFPAGTLASGTISVPLKHDAALSGTTAQFSVQLSLPSGATVSRALATVRILDIDSVTPVLELGAQEVYVAQSGTAVVRVYRSGTSSSNSIFTYSLVDGSAVSGWDYAGLDASVLNGATWVPGPPSAGTINGIPYATGTISGSNGYVDLQIPTGGTSTLQPLYFSIALTGTNSDWLNAAPGSITQATTYITTPSATEARIQFGSKTYSVSQTQDGINTVPVIVQRFGDLTQTSTVNFQTVPITAAANIDYQTIYGTLVFAPGEISKAIDITINPSSAVTGPVKFAVALSNPATVAGSGPAGATSSLGVNATTTVTITPTTVQNVVGFVSPSYSMNEESDSAGLLDNTASIGVQLTRSPADMASTVTVQVYTRQGTATADVDYQSISQTSPVTLTFGPYETVKTFTVKSKHDTTPESNETFSLVLSNPINAVIGETGTATVEIIDNDRSGVTQFTTTNYLVNEGDGTVTLNAVLSRTSGASDTVVVPYVVSSISAPESRYLGQTQGTVTFGPYVTSQQIVIHIADDLVVEPLQTFSVTLLPPSGGKIQVGSNSVAIVSITDNDGGNSVQFDSSVYGALDGDTMLIRLRASRGGDPGAALSIGYKITAGSADEANNYYLPYYGDYGVVRFAAGEDTAYLPISLKHDGFTGAKTFTITLTTDPTSSGNTTDVGMQSGALCKIYGTNGTVNTTQFLSPEVRTLENGPALIVPVIRFGPDNGADSKVGYSTRMTTAVLNPQNETAQPGVDFQPVSGEVTFAFVDRVWYSMGADGKAVEHKYREQTSIQYVTIPIIDNGRVTGDQFFNINLVSADNIQFGAQTTLKVWITDAEVGNRVQFRQSAYNVLKTDPQAVVVVQRDAYGNPNATGAVEYNILGINSTNGVDFRGASGLLLFGPGELSKEISIPIINNPYYVTEPKTFRVTLTNPSSGTVLGTPAIAIVTITDPAVATIPKVSISVPTARAIISKSGTDTGLFTVSRTGPTTSALTVNYDIRGTAVAGPTLGGAAYDYQYLGSSAYATSGSVVIPVGASSVDIPVTPHDNVYSTGDVDLILAVAAAGTNSGGLPDYLPGSLTSGAVTLKDLNQAGLGVSIAVDNVTPTVGDTVMYTLTVRNQGIGGDAYNVVLTQNFPSGLTFVSCDWPVTTVNSTSGVSYSASLGIVPNSSTIVVHLGVKPNAAFTYDSTAAVVTSSSDPYSGDNTTSPIRVSVKPAEVLTTDLNLTMGVSADHPTVGDQFTYTMTVTNSSANDAAGVVLTQSLPSTVTYLGADSGYAVTTGSTGLTTNLGIIPAGTSKTVHVQAMSTTQTTFDSTAAVTTTSNDKNQLNNSATVRVYTQPVVPVDLGVAMAVNNSKPAVGDQFTYTITVVNTSANDASGVILSQSLPASVTYLGSPDGYVVSRGAAGLSADLGIIAAGASKTLHIIAKSTTAFTFDSTASVTTTSADSYTANNVTLPVRVSVAAKPLVYLTQAIVDRTAKHSPAKNGHIVFNRNNNGIANALSVAYAVSGPATGAAKLGVDYKLMQGTKVLSGTVVFPKNVASVTVDVVPIVPASGKVAPSKVTAYFNLKPSSATTSPYTVAGSKAYVYIYR
ncbi:MAG: Calx-beta domain-containing protein [Verrucomicrobiota bacterium]